MKIKYLKLKNWLLVTLMSTLGLSACNSSKNVTKAADSKSDDRPAFDERQMIAMYGVPVRDLKVENADIAQPRVEPKADNPQEQPREPQVTVYGVPTVDFAVKGKVVDSNGKPLKGVQVMLVPEEIDLENIPETPYWGEMMEGAIDTTDSQGTFEVRTTDRPWQNKHVLVRDIDGSKNGRFVDQKVEVEFGEPERKENSNSWRLGEKKAEVTVKMKRKK